jgi:hypothetical protein
MTLCDLATAVDANEDALRNPQILIGAFTNGFTATPSQNAGLILEQTTHCLLADVPHGSDLRDGIVGLQSDRV